MMKRIILTFAAVLPILAMAQYPGRDTITYERDTILVYKITQEHTGHWFVSVDSLAGTLDATVEFVVANDLDSDAPATQPDDSVFVRYAGNMIQTISANGEYVYAWTDPVSFDYIGLKFTLNNVTKWHVKTKMELYSKSTPLR